MNYTAHYASLLGGMTMAGDGDSLTGLWFDDQKYFAAGLNPLHEEKSLPVFDLTVRWLDLYFSGREPGFTPPLRLNGSPFRMEVWRILRSVACGQTVTYGEIADRLARERGVPRVSARAVGGAVGHNPVSLIVPCHRVTGSGGRLTGYAGGIPRKAWLLELEKAVLNGSPVPRAPLL